MATEVVRGRTQEALKPPGACYLLLPGLEGAGIESLVSRASFCALRTPQPRGELERLLTTLNCSADKTSNRDGASYDVPTPTPARPFQKEGAALGFCCEGAHKNEAAFTKRTRACEGVSWPRSHSDIPSKGRPPRLRRSASHNNGPQVFLGVWVPAAPRL